MRTNATTKEAQNMRAALSRMSVGILVAVGAVTLAVEPTIGGISTWKVVLGVVGLVVFVLAGFDRKG
jgi:hypothetical protein